MIRVERHPNGPRLYVAGLRWHHGSAGAIAAAIATVCGAHRLAFVLALAALHDWRDFPFRDTDNH